MKRCNSKGVKIAAAFTLLSMIGSSGLFADVKIAENPTGKGKAKYVFVFVGDGMSYPQIQSAAYYAGKDAGGIVADVKKSENPSDSPAMKASAPLRRGRSLTSPRPSRMRLRWLSRRTESSVPASQSRRMRQRMKRLQPQRKRSQAV